MINKKFFPVSRICINSITIEIIDDNNNIVEFKDNCTVNFTLHFKHNGSR